MDARMFGFAVALAAVTGVFSIVPRITRPDFLFAVTVSRGFRQSAAARALVRRFYVISWGFTLAAIVVCLTTRMPLAALLLEAAGLILALAGAHARALRYGSPPAAVVSVDVSAPREAWPGGPVAALLPLALLAGLAIWAATHWDTLPAQFPVHWGLHGVDKWVATSPGTVYGLLAVLASVCGILLITGWGVLRWSRRISTGAGATAERRFRRRIVTLMAVTQYFLPGIAYFALFRQGGLTMDLWALALAVVIAVFAVGFIHAGQGGSRSAPPPTGSEGAPAGDRTPDRCWKWGMVYFNPDDPAILVEKRFGVGYTLNLGNRWSWFVMALMLCPVAIGLKFLK